MFRTLTAIAAIAAGAAAPAVAAGALEGAPTTAIDGVTEFSHVLAANGSGGALAMGTRINQLGWSVTNGGRWGAPASAPVPRESRTATALAGGYVAISADPGGLHANDIAADGAWGGGIALGRDGYQAVLPAAATLSRTTALVAFIEAAADGTGAREVRVAQVGVLPGGMVAFRQTVSTGERVNDEHPAIATGVGRALVTWTATAADGQRHLHAAIRQDAAWGAPVDLGPVGGTAPDVAADADGRLAVAYVGTDGRVRTRIAPAGAGFGNAVVISGSIDVAALDVELGTDGSAAVLWTRATPTGQRAEARHMAGGSWRGTADLGRSAVDGPGEQDMVAVAGGGYVAAMNTLHGNDDYGAAVAQFHGGSWSVSPADQAGDAWAELSPRLVALSDGDAMVSWVRMPDQGFPLGQLRAQRVSANAPIAPQAPAAPIAPVAPAPPVAPAGPAVPAHAPAPAPAAAAANPAAAQARTPRLRVRWTRSGRTVRATIVRRADSTGYRMVARKGKATKRARCIAKRVKGVRRQVCTVKLGRGTWAVTAVSRKGSTITARAHRTHRAR